MEMDLILYISVRLFAIPAELSIYILIGFYLGIQKTKISSLLIMIMSFLNIILSAYFVLTLNLNIFGVALGSLIACYFVLILWSVPPQMQGISISHAFG